MIALPNGSTVFACAVPYFAALKAAAFTADYFSRKTTATCFVSDDIFALLELMLNKVIDVRRNYGRMAVFNEILWYFTFI
jgi:hypothetical protein